MEYNKEAIEAAGFKVDTAGNIRNAAGQRVSKDAAEQIAAGGIIANFNLDDLRKKKTQKAANGGLSMVEALDQIAPAISLLKVGMTAKIAMPKDKVTRKVKGGGEKELDPKRSFVMSIVTKLNNVTAKGREWAGRRFDSLSDEDGSYFYVTRIADTDEPHVRKPGGAPKKNGGGDKLTTALAQAKEHLAGTNGEATQDDAALTAKVEDAAPGDVIRVGGTEGGENVTEEATVLAG